MWRLRFLWPITIGPCLDEGARSGLRLTGEPRDGYARFLENDPLIRPEGENSGRRTIFGNTSAPVRGSQSVGDRFFAMKRPGFRGIAE